MGDVAISPALCDLGAKVSLMPYSICKNFHMHDLKPTTISLQLANRSVRYPLGIPEDIPLPVEKFSIPYDFDVIEIEEDVCIPIILGRHILATVGVMINVKNVKLSLQVRDKKVEFHLP